MKQTIECYKKISLCTYSIKIFIHLVLYLVLLIFSVDLVNVKTLHEKWKLIIL